MPPQRNRRVARHSGEEEQFSCPMTLAVISPYVDRPRACAGVQHKGKSFQNSLWWAAAATGSDLAAEWRLASSHRDTSMIGVT